MTGVYSMWGGPTYKAASPNDMMLAALDQPLSRASTFFGAAEQGILGSLGLGTAIRDLITPEGNTEGSVMEPAFGMAALPVPAAYSILKRGIQSVINPDQPSMTQDQWKASAYFREGIPWDEGMTEARAASLASQFDHKKAREFYSAKRPITAFIGGLAGQALDPVNYVPVAGPLVKAAAVSRVGLIAGEVATGALDAAANTALFGTLTASERAKYGDDVSWQSTVSQIATAALIGGAFGAVGGALERRALSKAQDRLQTLRDVQDARIALNEAIDGLVHDGEVNLGPNALEPLNRVARETRDLSAAYDTVRENPTGPARDPLVAITPEEIEGTIVTRGAFKDINEADVGSKRGWGLVKIIWGHGDQSGESPEFRIAKDDVTALPEVIRAYEPSSVSDNGALREWRVERNGRKVVYADSMMPEGRHVVTAYVQRPDRAGADAPLSEKRKPAAAESFSEAGNPIQDTERGLNPQRTVGQPSPAATNISRLAPIDNTKARPEPATEGAAQAAGRVAKTENVAALAEQHRVDPKTGDFPELADIERLKAEGRISEEDMAALDDAAKTLDDADAYGEALKAIVGCFV